MANTIRALKLMASLGKLDSVVPKLPVSASSSESESSESEDEKVVYKRVYKKKTVAKSDALPVHPSASMPASTFVPPAKQPLPPAPSVPPAPPAPKVPKVRKPRAKKLTASEAPVAQPSPQAEPKVETKVEPKIETKVEPPSAEAPAEKKGRTKKVKKAPSAYNTFVGKMMKEGKSMKEASAAWKAQKN